ncbi:MAG: galactokinase [Bacteroidota bacterium]
MSEGRVDGETGDVLSTLYDGELLERKREQMQILLREFQTLHPDAGNVRVARAPGRVNLIGEHTDYNGYPVLPMAVDRDILLAFTGGSGVDICNLDPRYEQRRFSAKLPLDRSARGDWSNYVKAALSGLLEEKVIPPGAFKGLRGLFAGDIPGSAGLSSSSALVVVTALALLAVHGVETDRLILADLLARAERFSGTEGGGMDQAACLLGQPGKALKVEFFPLRVTPVDLPDDASFIVCHSLVHATKTGESRLRYNLRVAECGMAVALLRQALSRRLRREFEPRRLSDFEKEEGAGTIEERLQMGRDALGPAPLSLREIGIRLGLSPGEVRDRYCRMRDGTVIPEPEEGFKIWSRFRHVLSEAMRVENAEKTLGENDVQSFGDLMNRSHESCRRDFEISCPQLDRLVQVARDNGAIGSRLTGAGFGGCTVSLVPKGEVERFFSGVAEEYYGREAGDPNLAAGAMFPARAVEGAGLLIS